MTAEISQAQLTWDLDDPDYHAPLVTIFGAGIAGLTAAHELAERGFHVQVVEPKESQFEEYECDVGGMAANQFSRVPAPLGEVHPSLPDEPDGELDRLRQVRRFYEEAYEFERAPPRFPIKQRLRFHKRAYPLPDVRASALGQALQEQAGRFEGAIASYSLARRDKVPLDWQDYWDDHDVKNRTKLQEVLHIIKDAHAFYSARYAEREEEALRSRPELAGLPLQPRNRRREILLIRIIGYTDSDGLPEINRQTGEYWAEEVQRALLELNDKQRAEFRVPDLKDHLEVVGAGATELRGDPADPVARARSNRVEFQIVEQALPGEHGFRFFPNFYRHLFDTMRRTPILGGLGEEARLTAFDQLVPTPEAFLALEDNLPPFRVRLRRFRSLVQIREALEYFVGRLAFNIGDFASFNLKFQRYMTSGRARRERETEDCNFIDYFQGPRPYSEAAFRFLNATPRALAAMSATETDARTQCNILLQLLGQDPHQPSVDDMTLNGPTSEVWLKPWKRYLIRQGVRFFVGRLKGLHLDGAEFIPMVEGPDAQMVPRPEDARHHLRGRMVDPSGQPIEPDAAGAVRGRRQFYVLALPFEAASDVVERARQAAPGMELRGAFQQLADYNDHCGRRTGEQRLQRGRNAATGQPRGNDPLRDISGIQYFFPHNYRLEAGHVYWVNSPWALTSISQLAFWRDRVRPVGDYIGQLSVDLGDWYAGYARRDAADPEAEPEPGDSAWHSTRWEIARNCWEQIKAGLSPEHRAVINPPRYYHLDLGIVFSEEKYVGSHGNLILTVSPTAVRQETAPASETYRLLLTRSAPSEEPEERDDPSAEPRHILHVSDAASTDADVEMAAAAREIAAKISRQADFAFAVYEPFWLTKLNIDLPTGAPEPDPAEIIVSPVVMNEEIVIYFRGQSSYHYYVRIDGRVMIIPPATSEADANIPYYVTMFQKEFEADKEHDIEIAFIGSNHVVLRSNREIACAVANRDDMIEIVDGPRLEAKSRYPNLQVIGRPGRTSGVGRAAAFRANALIEADVPTSAEAVYPEPGRLYRLTLTVDTEEGTRTLRAKHKARRKEEGESAATLFEALIKQIEQDGADTVIHVEPTTVGEAENQRPAILVSPYAKASEILIRINGSSARPFKIVVDGRTCALDAARLASATDVRGALLELLTRELAGSRGRGGIVVAAVGRQCLRLRRRAAEGSAAAAGEPIVAMVCNVDGMIELVGAPLVEVRTKDLLVQTASREPVPLRNDTPFQINPPGHWRHRPGHAAKKRARGMMRSAFPGREPEDAGAFEYGHPACPALQSWIATGTYMTTYTRLTTMEAANESGRHAVNAILRQLLDDAEREAGRAYRRPRARLFGDYCWTRDVEDEEFEDLKFFKELDDALLEQGLPHVHDILQLQDPLGLGQEPGLPGAGRESRPGDLAMLAALSGTLGPFFLSKALMRQLDLVGDLLRARAGKDGDR